MSAGMLSKPYLLIVDDSRTSRMLLRALVNQQRPEWRIEEACNGNEALNQVSQETPDFVSMDVNMPGPSGLEIAGRIRLNHPSVRIVLCTANIQASVRHAAVMADLYFVPKPITPSTILEALTFWEAAPASTGVAQS